MTPANAARSIRRLAAAIKDTTLRKQYAAMLTAAEGHARGAGELRRAAAHLRRQGLGMGYAPRCKGGAK